MASTTAEPLRLIMLTSSLLCAKSFLISLSVKSPISDLMKVFLLAYIYKTDIRVIDLII